MSARDEILGRIRTALGDRPRDAPESRRDYRTEAAPDIDLFVERVVDYRATVTRARPDEVTDVIAALVDGTVVVPDEFPRQWLPPLDALSDSPRLDVHVLDRIPTVLTTCAVAIAETGTIVLDAGPGQGRRALSLVPDHHIVVVRTDQVVGGVPGAVRRLDATRPQTWISGPSATSDIELNRVEGVHGPRRLDVILVG
jgi:L-lactate dehydrogenase complex protein LldG